MRLAPSSVPLFLLRSICFYEPHDTHANAPHDCGKQARITRKYVSEWTHVNERRISADPQAGSKESKGSRVKGDSSRSVMILAICAVIFVYALPSSSFGPQAFMKSPKSASRSFATLLQFAVMITHAAYSRWQSMSEIIRYVGVACTKRIMRESRISSNR